jgi:hypothetical protein
MEENMTLNHGDPGSSPGLTTNPEIAPMVERELEELRVGGSNPPLGANSQIAQLEERRTLTPEVVGSIPTLAANRDQLEELDNSLRSHRRDYGFDPRTGHQPHNQANMR